MKKFSKFLFILPLLFATSLQATELNTTAVNKALKQDLDPSGNWKSIRFTDGTSQTTAASGGGASSFSALTGSATSSQLPSDPTFPGTVTVGGISGNGAGITNIASTANSAALAAALSDETGTNTVVFSSSPTIASPTFTGTATGTFSGTHTGSGAGLTGITASATFATLTGSPTDNTKFLVNSAGTASSGFVPVGDNNGKLKNSWMPDTLRLPATTTVQSDNTDVVVTNISELKSTIVTDSNTKMLLLCNNPGSSTVTDSSSAPLTFTNIGSPIGTTTVKFGSGALHIENGVSEEAITIGTNTTLSYAGNFTDELWINFITKPVANPFRYIIETGATVLRWTQNTDNTMTFQHDAATVFTGWSFNPTVSTWYHVAVQREGGTWTAWYGTQSGSVGVQMGTATYATAINIDGAFKYLRTNGETMNTLIDEYRHSTVARYPSGAYLVPDTLDPSNKYTSYSMIVSSPVSGNQILKIETPGTSTANASIVSFNASHTIIGSSTSAYAPTGTTTIGYKLLCDTGKGLAQDWVLTPSSSKVKTDLPGNPTKEVLDIVRVSDSHKFLYKDKIVSAAAAELKAIDDYTREDEKEEYGLYREAHQNEYLEGVVGSMSVNLKKMEKDFEVLHKNNKLIEWNNGFTGKTDRIQRTKAYLEMDKSDSRNNTINYGIEIDKNCPAEILDENGLPSMAKWQGFNFAAIKGLVEIVDAQKAEIGSLTAALNNLRVINNLK